MLHMFKRFKTFEEAESFYEELKSNPKVVSLKVIDKYMGKRLGHDICIIATLNKD